MDIDIDALEVAARKATAGPWDVKRSDQRTEFWFEAGYLDVGPAMIGVEYGKLGKQEVADADFIAAANPAVVLELVRRLRAAEEKASTHPLTLDWNKSEDIMLKQLRAAESFTKQKSTYHHVVMRAFRWTLEELVADVKAGNS